VTDVGSCNFLTKAAIKDKGPAQYVAMGQFRKPQDYSITSSASKVDGILMSNARAILTCLTWRGASSQRKPTQELSREL
jgi:hypothetical protein